MQIQEARALKADVEAKIKALVVDFESKTGLAVEDIQVKRTPHEEVSYTSPTSRTRIVTENRDFLLGVKLK